MTYSLEHAGGTMPASPLFAGAPGWRPIERSGFDRLLLGLITLAMCLEIVVFIEPAPVDALLMLALGLALLLGKWSPRLFAPAPVGALGIFLLANLLSLFDPLEPDRAVSYLVITAYLVASWFLFVGIGGCYGLPVAWRLMDAYTAAGVVSALLGIGGYFHLLPSSETFLLNGRAKGLFKDCNVYGPFFVPVALWAMSQLGHTGRLLPRMALTGAACLASGAMLLSFSRACWINAGVSLVVFFTLQLLSLPSSAARRKRAAQSVLALAVALGAGWALLQTPAVSQMMELRVSANGLQSYDRVRFGTHDLAYQSALDHPLGIGPGQSEPVFIIATHSMYLRVLSENGIVALLAFLAFIGATLQQSLKNSFRASERRVRELNIVVSACLLGHLVNSAVIDTVHWRHIWFLYALPWMSAALAGPRIAARARGGSEFLAARNGRGARQ